MQLSIVMPVKNREDMVSDAIDSVLEQTYQDWELIIVDDHSTDKTKDVINGFKDKRIKLYSAPKNITGVGAVRKYGNTKVKADIIVIADSDDINYPNRLEITNKYFEAGNIDILYGNIDMWHVQTNKIETRWFQPFNAELLREYDFIPNAASAYTREAYESVEGYDASLILGEDYDLWLQMLDRGKRFGFVDEPFVKIRKQLFP